MKNCKTHILQCQLAAACIVLLSCLLAPGSTLAQTAPKMAGELVSAKGASLNNVTAISGLTVFSGSKMKTASGGAATIALGKAGRFELGSDTEMTLSFSANSVGGELVNGRAVMSVPAGVSISVITVEGRVASDGKKPSVVAIDLTGQRARVVVYMGDAKIYSSGKTEQVSTGEEVVMHRQSQNKSWQRGRVLATGAVGAAGTVAAVGQMGGRAATTAATTATVTAGRIPAIFNLVNAGVGLSMASVIAQGESGLNRDPNEFFQPTISCRDSDSPTCQRRSTTVP